MKASSMSAQEIKQTKTPEQAVEKNPFDEFKPFINEVRRSFWVITAVFAVGVVVGIAYYKQILTLALSFFDLENINVVLTSPYQFINLSINAGFFVGVVFTFPVFLYYFLRFIKPALKPNEYKLLVKLLPMSVLLFIIGFGFGVWVFQYVVAIFSSVSSGLAVDNIWDLSGFLAQIIITGVSMALVFQMPIAITTLVRLNLVPIKAIAGKRKEIYAGLFILAALLPPTDLISLIILTFAPIFLFESALLLNRSSI
jgi:sec-independent protein translocase protein TatC